MGEWISGAEAADVIGVHRNTVLARLKNPADRERWFGAEGDGWRYRPLTKRTIFEIRRARAEWLAKNPLPADEPKQTG